MSYAPTYKIEVEFKFKASNSKIRKASKILRPNSRYKPHLFVIPEGNLRFFHTCSRF